MNALKLDALAIQKMASGHLSLNLSECVSWQDFPNYAECFVKLMSGEIIEQSDAVDIRLWNVLISGTQLQLVFDDFPIMTSLESLDAEGDRVVEETYRKLAAGPQPMASHEPEQQ